MSVTSLAALVNVYRFQNEYALYEVTGDRVDTVGVWGSNPHAPTIFIQQNRRFRLIRRFRIVHAFPLLPNAPIGPKVFRRFSDPSKVALTRKVVGAREIGAETEGAC
jgi:hypothetical protein